MKLGPNQQKWVDALRSGEYSQTRRALHDKRGFCCLGVATDVLGVKTGISEWEPEETDYYFTYQEAVSNCPLSIVKELALNDSTGGMSARFEINSCQHSTLVSINDYTDLSFHQIADFMEENAGYLFRHSA